MHCCVPQCNNDSRYNSSLSFHRFPKKDDQLRANWIVKIRRDIGDNFKVGANYNPLNSSTCEISLNVLSFNLRGYLRVTYNYVSLGLHAIF